MNVVLFLMLACLWSGSFIGIKATVSVWPPLFSAGIRVGIAFICLIILRTLLHKTTKAPYSLCWKIWMIGLFSQGIPFAFLFWGEQLVSPGLAGIINGTVPIWTFILGLALFPKLNRFSVLTLSGLLIGVTGVIIIFWPILSFERTAATAWGASSILIMALSYAIGNLLNQHFLAGKYRIDFFTNIFHQHFASFIFLTILSISFESWPSFATLSSSSTAWIASLYLGIFSTALAWMIYYHLIRAWDGLRASTVMYIVPGLTLFWDYAFYKNAPHITEIFGVITILCGVILIQALNFRNLLLKKKRANLLI